jgi:hypothetical protein
MPIILLKIWAKSYPDNPLQKFTKITAKSLKILKEKFWSKCPKFPALTVFFSTNCLSIDLYFDNKKNEIKYKEKNIQIDIQFTILQFALYCQGINNTLKSSEQLLFGS